MSFRQERLEKIIEREIGSFLLLEAKDERLKFVTITKVRLTNDLSIATVYFTVIGNDTQRQSTAQNFEDAKGMIRGHLGKVLEIRKIPELRFKYDESFEYGEQIENILKNLK